MGFRAVVPAGRGCGVNDMLQILNNLIVILGIILGRTRLGRSVYMVGRNSTAAFLAGINQERLRVSKATKVSSLHSKPPAILA